MLVCNHKIELQQQVNIFINIYKIYKGGIFKFHTMSKTSGESVDSVVNKNKLNLLKVLENNSNTNNNADK